MLQHKLLRTPMFNAEDLANTDLYGGQYDTIASTSVDVVIQEELLRQARTEPKRAYKARKADSVSVGAPPNKKQKNDNQNTGQSYENQRGKKWFYKQNKVNRGGGSNRGGGFGRGRGGAKPDRGRGGNRGRGTFPPGKGRGGKGV